MFQYHLGQINQIRAYNISLLFEEAREIGVPVSEELRDYVENYWFASLRFWFKIQREIDEFHMKYHYLSVCEEYIKKTQPETSGQLFRIHR